MRSLLSRISTLHIVLGLIVLSFLAFGLHVANPFISLDDNYLIYANPDVQKFTMHGVAHVFSSYDPQLYIPVTFLSWQLNAVFLGLNAFSFHLVNVLLHCGNAILVFFILKRLSKNVFLAGLAAAFFAVHPIQTEAVLWAASRKDLLSSFFFLLSTLSYLRYRADESRHGRLWSIMFFVLGTFSKVSVVTLPVWLLGIDWLEKRRFDRSAFLEKLPYFAVAIIGGVIAIYGKSRVLQSSGTLLNILLPAKSAVFYLQKFFWPVGLSVIYPYTGEAHGFLTDFGIPLIVIAALGILCVVLALRGKQRLIPFLLFTYFLLLAPSFSTFWKNGFLYFASDRYVYLASIGFFAIVAFAFDRLRLKIGLGSTLISAVLVAACIPLSYAQGRVWNSSEALYRNVVRFYPNSVMAVTNLGLEVQHAGDLKEARQLYERAMQLDPHSVHAYFNLASLENDEGHPDAATKLYVAIVDAFGPQQIGSVSDVRPFLWLIRRLNDLGKTSDAERLFNKLNAMAPDLLQEAYERQQAIDAQ